MPAPPPHPRSPARSPGVVTPKKTKPKIRSDRGVALLPPLVNPASPSSPSPSFLLSPLVSSSVQSLSLSQSSFAQSVPSLSEGTVLELAEAHRRVKAQQLGTAGIRTVASFLEKNKVVVAKFKSKQHKKTDRASELVERVLYGGKAKELEGERTVLPLGGVAAVVVDREYELAEARKKLEALSESKANSRKKGMQFYEKVHSKSAHDDHGSSHHHHEEGKSHFNAANLLHVNLHVNVNVGALTAGFGNFFHAKSPDHGKSSPASKPASSPSPSPSPQNNNNTNTQKSSPSSPSSPPAGDGHTSHASSASPTPPAVRERKRDMFMSGLKSTFRHETKHGKDVSTPDGGGGGFHFHVPHVDLPFGYHHSHDKDAPKSVGPRPLLPLSTYKRYYASLQPPPAPTSPSAADSHHHHHHHHPDSPSAASPDLSPHAATGAAGAPPSSSPVSAHATHSPSEAHSTPQKKGASSPSSWWGGGGASASSSSPTAIAAAAVPTSPASPAAAHPTSSTPTEPHSPTPTTAEPAKKSRFGNFHLPAVHVPAFTPPKMNLHLPNLHVGDMLKHVTDGIHHLVHKDISSHAELPFSYRKVALAARETWSKQPSAHDEFVRGYVRGCILFGVRRATDRLQMQRHTPFEDPAEREDGGWRRQDSAGGEGPVFKPDDDDDDVPFNANNSVYSSTLEELFSSVSSPIKVEQSTLSIDEQESFWSVVERAFFVVPKKPPLPPPPIVDEEPPPPEKVPVVPRVKLAWKERITWLDEVIKLHNDNYGGGEGQGGDGGELRMLSQNSGLNQYKRPPAEPDWLKRGTPWADKRVKNAKEFVDLTASEEKVQHYLKEDLCRSWDVDEKRPKSKAKAASVERM